MLDHEPISVGDIQNYYGNLFVKVEKGIPFWCIEDYCDNVWEDITDNLYYHLLDHNRLNKCKDKPYGQRGT